MIRTDPAAYFAGVADEVLHDVVLALGGVAAHVELDGLLHVTVLGADDRRQAHAGADEVLELLGVQLAKALEARDLAVPAALGDGLLALLVGEAVVLLLVLGLWVANAEEWRLEDEHALVEDQLAVEAHEERGEEHADVEAVHVGVGREDDLAVAEVLERLLDVERLYEVEELLVLVEDVLV